MLDTKFYDPFQVLRGLKPFKMQIRQNILVKSQFFYVKF